jgi:hypothetical protein
MPVINGNDYGDQSNRLVQHTRQNLFVNPLNHLRSVAKIWSTQVVMERRRPLWIGRNNRLRDP